MTHRGAAVPQNSTHPTPNVPTKNSYTYEATGEIAVAHSINNLVITLDEISELVKHDQPHIDLITTI